MRLELNSVRHALAPAEVQRRKDEALTLEKVRRLGAERRAFPMKEHLRLAMICAQTSQVEEDFLRELGEQREFVEVQILRTRIDDAGSIADTLRAVTGADIVALIRGGGPNEDFAVFNDPKVVEAFAAVKGFRLLGVGHAKHVSVLDFVVDYAATTPTAAGGFVARQMEQLKARLDRAREAERALAAPQLDQLRRGIASEQASSAQQRTAARWRSLVWATALVLAAGGGYLAAMLR